MKTTQVYRLGFVGFLAFAEAAYAQNASLPGAPGRDPNWNVSWLDLPSSTTFSTGTTLDVSFVDSHLREMVVRFVADGCDYDLPCMIDCNHIDVKNGHARITIAQTYTNIKQISFHSGIGGHAFGCAIDGGPMPRLSEIRLVK
jgi:hypothetical protein